MKVNIMVKDAPQQNIIMKDSGIDWIGEIPNDWELLRIKNIFNLSKEKINGSSEKYQIYSLTIQGLKKRNISTNEGQIAVSYDKYARLRINDLVLNPMDLISGFIGRQKEDGIISPAYSLLRPRDKNQDTKYFERYLQYHYFYNIFFPFGKGVSYDYRWTLGDIALMNFPIVRPPKETQGKIVEFLDEKMENISELIERKKKMIKLLKEKRSSIITHAVTKGIDLNVEMKDSGVDWVGKIPSDWKIKRLKNVSTYNDETLSERTPNDFEFEYIDISSVALAEGVKNTEKMIYKNAPSRARRIVACGDIIVSTVRTYLRSIATITDKNSSCIVSTGFAVIRPKKINKSFLSYFLQSESFVYSVISCSDGVAYPAINASRLVELNILEPNKETQQKIVKFLEKKTSEIDNIITKIEKQIKLLGEYKASLIYHAVTGKIQEQIQ